MQNICKVALYVKICDEIMHFCKDDLKAIIGLKRLRSGKMSIEEMLTLSILYHFSASKHKKAFYSYIDKKDFPALPSYDKFNLHLNSLFNLTKTILDKYLVAFNDDLGYLDSTKVETTKPYYRGKVYNRASNYLPKSSKGYSSTGTFYGFKLHILINSKKLLNKVQITSAKTHDLSPVKEGMLNN